MKPALYYWKNMARDYARFLLDDKWYWCRHCRRPVEHALMTPLGALTHRALTCLDCGYADPDFLQVNTERRTASDF